jgi:uncharacterized protein (DUF302 family)
VAFGVKAVVHEPLGSALERVRGALADNGLDVVTEINITTALQGYSAAPVPDQIVLGVISSLLALAVARAEPSVGLLLPWNVVVRSGGGAVSYVEAMDPVVMVALTGDPHLEPVASQVTERLRAAFLLLADADDLVPLDPAPQPVPGSAVPGPAAG